MKTMARVAMTTILAAAVAALVALSATGGGWSLVAAQSGGGRAESQAPVQRGAWVMLVAPEGRTDLRDAPGSAVVRATAQAGTLARLVDWARHEGKWWALVALPDGEGSGWVPWETLRLESAGPAFGNFRFFAGDAAGPTGEPRGALRLADEGLWLRYDFSGLRAGDAVQRVLVAGGQRFQSAPTVWQGAGSGQAWVNLLDHRPRLAAGTWTVQFFVNGAATGSTSVVVQ